MTSLQQYTVKSDSKQLPTNSFQSSYTQGLVQPLYNPEALARVMEMNTYHYRACKTKARDTAGLGWNLRPLKENPSSEAIQEAGDFFSEMYEPISEIL